jgi:hypothetical protein
MWYLGDGNDLINDYSIGKNTPDLEEHRLIFQGMTQEDIYQWITSADVEYETSGELSEIRFADGTIWDSSDIAAIAEGSMAPFSMSMTQVARAFWNSLPNESEAASSNSHYCL